MAGHEIETCVPVYNQASGFCFDRETGQDVQDLGDSGTSGTGFLAGEPHAEKHGKDHAQQPIFLVLEHQELVGPINRSASEIRLGVDIDSLKHLHLTPPYALASSFVFAAWNCLIDAGSTSTNSTSTIPTITNVAPFLLISNAPLLLLKTYSLYKLSIC